MDAPKSLQEAILFFADPDNCIAYMKAQRWPDGIVVCPTCGRNDVAWLAKQRKWQCKSAHTKRQFSAKVGTIFEDSPIPLDKWLMAGWMLANCKNGISSYELARDIQVSQKSAWFMLHRLRVAMIEKGGKLGGSGPVEIDETFVGGKMKNVHKSKRKPIAYQGGKQMAVVLGMLERGGKVRAGVIESRQRHSIQPPVHANVEMGSEIITDELPTYQFVAQDRYLHEVINHVEGYVRDHVHTNGIENFWALLKRGLGGTYISVEPVHLDAYVTEQVYRYNNRKDMNDAGRFSKLLSQVAGKRLTYAELTGKEAGTAVS
jgi:transposase-like protein